jgi:hypothetical protein
MKKVFKYSVIFFLLLCIFAPSGFVNALPTCTAALLQSNTPCDLNTTPAAPTTNTAVVTGNCTLNGQVTVTTSDKCPAANFTPTSQLNSGGSSGACTSLLNFSMMGCLYSALAWIGYMILGVMSWILWLSGTMLDWVLSYTIVQMSANISTMTGINAVWKVIRDLANIAFIFVLLYEAILLILSKSSTEKIKGIIAGIVITALLINFSLFFTKIIIDASNVVTIGFYQSIVGTSQPVSGSTTGAQGTTLSSNGATGAGNTFNIPPGISGAFVNNLNIVQFFTSQDPSQMQTGQDNKSIFMISLGGSVMFLVLAFAFFAVSIMYLIRYIVLIVLLMSAPLGYLGFGLPMLKSTQSTWWNTLIGQCIFAPLWMFCCWAILTLVGSPGFLTLQGANGPTTLQQLAANGTFTGMLGGGSAQNGGIPLLVNFGIIIGLIIGSLTLAKKYAGQGSSLISKYTEKVTVFAGGAVMGSAAAAGRKTVGRYAANKADDEDLKRRAASGDKIAQLQLKTYRTAAGASFDVRRSGIGEQVAKATGTDFGKGTVFNANAGKGGFKKEQEDKVKKEQEYVKSLKPSDVEYEKAKEKDNKVKEGLEKTKKDADTEKEKSKADLDQSQKKLDVVNKEIEKLEKDKKDAMLPEMQKSIQDKIDLAKNQMKAESEINTRLKEIFDQKSKAAEDAKKKFDEGKDKNEKDLNKMWDERKNAYADSVENAWMKRYAVTALGGLAGAAVAGPWGAAAGTVIGKAFGGTKEEQEHIARKIRNETGKKKEKSKKEKKEDAEKLKNKDLPEEERDKILKDLVPDEE